MLNHSTWFHCLHLDVLTNSNRKRPNAPQRYGSWFNHFFPLMITQRENQGVIMVGDAVHKLTENLKCSRMNRFKLSYFWIGEDLSNSNWINLWHRGTSFQDSSQVLRLTGLDWNISILLNLFIFQNLMIYVMSCLEESCTSNPEIFQELL